MAHRSPPADVVPAWHRDLLDERLADDAANPDTARPWEEVDADLRARFPEREKPPAKDA